MAFIWSSNSNLVLLGLLSLFHPFTTTPTVESIRIGTIIRKPSPELPIFREAPSFRNGNACGSKEKDIIHVAMTLDVNYLRGTMAAVLSILQHSTCPENLSFHFLSVHNDSELNSTIHSTFPFLNFKIYHFNSSRVRSKISRSFRQALDQPLNYAMQQYI